MAFLTVSRSYRSKAGSPIFVKITWMIALLYTAIDSLTLTSMETPIVIIDDTSIANESR
jgi:hypothetical protein